MSDIDKIIKSSIDGYEAPFDPQAWERLSSQLSPFEDVFREAVEDYEAPYNDDAWTNVNKHLGPNKNVIGWLIGSAAVLGIIFTTIAILPENESTMLTADQPSKLVDSSIKDVKTIENNINANDQAKNIITETTESQKEEVNNVKAQHNLPVVEKLNPTNKTTLKPTIVKEPTQIDIKEFEHKTNSKADESIPVIEDKTIDAGTITKVNYNAKFDASALTICQNESIQFNPNKTYTDVLYVWDFGDGNYSAESFPNHNYSKSGNFNVKLSLKDSKTNKDLATYSSSVQVNALPDVDFAWEKSLDIIPTIKFINLTKEANLFAWKVQDKMCSDKNQFEHTFRTQGIYNVELLAEANNGCQNKISKQINIEDDYNLLAPTAFSPNGDNINDFFIPKALKILDQEFTMTIYNQAGKLIFQTSNINQPWDGRVAIDNNEAPQGAYVWLVKIMNANDQLEQYTGQVILTK
mgnify:CR=1 FL=1